MEVRLYSDADRHGWDQFVMNHPQGSFFHLTGWKRVVEKSFGHRSFYLLAEDYDRESMVSNGTRHNGRKIISGVFPLFMIKSFLFGKSLVSVPFAPIGGILATNKEVEQALLDKAAEITRSEGLDYLEIRNQNAPLPDLPVKDLYYYFKKELFTSEEDNLKAIPRKTRRMVRQGISNGLESVHGGKELLDEFYELFAYNYRSLGTPVFPKRYLGNQLEEFSGFSSILIIRKDGQPLSGVLSYFYKEEVLPYYSGAYPISRDHAANDYLYWALMCKAVDRGCEIFDFGKSKKDTGPYHFKRHWGFEPSMLPYQYYLHGVDALPNLSPTNPKYSKRIELWKKLPLELTKLIGPQIVKYIP